MMPQIRRFLFAASLALTLCASARATVLYTVTDITPGGFSRINNNSQVVGTWDGATATLWENGVTTDLGAPSGYAGTTAMGISQSGQYICAFAYNASPTDGTAVLWDNLVMSVLPPLEGDACSFAFGVNDAGVVVGGSGMGTDESARAVYWQDGVAHALATLGGQYGKATDITDSGLIAGESARLDGTSVACLWTDGVPTDLGTLPGYWGSWTRTVNESGQVVIISSRQEDGANVYTSALWDAGVLTPIESVGDRTCTYVYDINESDQAVGMLCMGDLSDASAMVWRDGITFDLNWLIDPDSGWVLTTAQSINDSGQIVGKGYCNGEYRRFLLDPVQPVPAPGALLLGCVGLGLAAVCRKARPGKA